MPEKPGRVVIVGGGPAGLRAAEMLVGCGVTPTLLDEAPRIGGRIYQQPPSVAGFACSAQALYGFEADKAGDLHAAFERIREKIDYRPNALAFDLIDNDLHVLVGGRIEVLTFDAANGKPLWRAQVSSEILAAPTVGDGVVIVRSGVVTPNF